MMIYVLNATTLALSHYTLVARELVVHDGELYAVSATALTQRSGNDDAGAPIDARIKYGDMHLGSEYSKRCHRAHLTSKGPDDIEVRTHTMERGAAVERSYNFGYREAEADEFRERWKDLGRGASSIRWSFELRNVAGGKLDFNAFGVRVGAERALR